VLYPNDYTEDEFRKVLGAAEKLLIYKNAPSFNTQWKNTNKPVRRSLMDEMDGKDYLVQNYGDQGSILPECSTIIESPEPGEMQKLLIFDQITT
jgi:hypothetical protein